MTKLDWQTAGDVHRNTKSLELWDEKQKHIADVIRYDDTNHLKINTYGNEIDLAVLQTVIELALDQLGAFEDGTPLTEATLSQEVLPQQKAASSAAPLQVGFEPHTDNNAIYGIKASFIQAHPQF